MAHLAGYLRVSFVGTRADRLRSPQEQTDEINEWARSRQHTVDFLDPELDGKGTNPARPILRQAVEGVKVGRWDGIVVAYLSRAGRELRLMLDLWDEVEGAGGAVYFARENLDASTAAGRMQRNILASVAQYELEERRAGFERSTKGAVERGIWQRRQTPRGYDRDPETRTLVPNEDASSVKQAAADYLQGTSLVELARRLGMTPGGVRGMLRNRVYLGELKVRSYLNAEAHEPILDVGAFEAVQAKLAAAPRPPRSTTAAPMLLAGLVRCAACGHVMTRARSHADLVYRCVKNHSGEVCPGPAAISCSRIDPYVEAIAIEELARMKVTARAGNEVEQAQEALEAAKAELSNYLAAVDMAGISAPDAAAGMRSRREKVEKADARLRSELSRTPSLPIIERGDEVWGDLNSSERNLILRGLLAAVGVRSVGAGVRVDVAERVRVWRFGADLTLPGGRTGSAGGIVPLPWPDADAIDVLSVPAVEDPG